MARAKHNIFAHKIPELASGFREAQADERVTEILVDEFVGELARLPAGVVSQVDGWLPLQAGLLREREMGWFGITRASPPRNLLRRYPRIAWLFLFHRDGYVRQAALDTLREPPPTGFFVAALALRMNDWVEPVAVAATHRFRALMLATSPEVIVGSASFLLDRWRYWGRWTDESSALLDTLFSRPDVVSAFAEHLRRDAIGPLGREMTNFLRAPALDPHLARLAIEARSPVVRAVALKTQITGRASWPCGFEEQWVDKVYGRSRIVLLFRHREIETGMPLTDAIRLGLKDRSVFVRRIAADALTERPSQFEDVEELIAAMGRDRSPSIRERADYLLRHLVET